MDKAHFFALVVDSLVSLKENANPKDLAKLNFETLNPNRRDSCILGQMYGEFGWDDAREVAPKTLAIQASLFKNKKKYCNVLEADFWSEIASFKENTIEMYVELPTTLDVELKYSAFEHFILIEGANIKEVIEFLKGERDTFEPHIEEHI